MTDLDERIERLKNLIPPDSRAAIDDEALAIIDELKVERDGWKRNAEAVAASKDELSRKLKETQQRREETVSMVEQLKLERTALEEAIEKQNIRNVKTLRELDEWKRVAGEQAKLHDESSLERDELRGGVAFTHPLCSDCERAVVWHDPGHPSPVRMCPRCVHARMMAAERERDEALRQADDYREANESAAVCVAHVADFIGDDCLVCEREKDIAAMRETEDALRKHLAHVARDWGVELEGLGKSFLKFSLVTAWKVLRERLEAHDTAPTTATEVVDAKGTVKTHEVAPDD